MFAGAYRIQRTSPGFIGFQAILYGMLTILLIYSLLPETWRTSRAIILFSGLILSALIPLSRILLKPQGFGYRALLFGDKNAEKKLNALFRILSFKNNFAYITRMDPGHPDHPEEIRLGQLNNMVTKQNITHLILADTPEWKTTLLKLTRSRKGNPIYLLEDSGHTPYLHPGPIPGLKEVEIRLNNPVYQWSKSMINIVCSILILPWGWIRPEIRMQFFRLLTGKIQWVSYLLPADPDLPRQKPGLWQPAPDLGPDRDQAHQLNFEYAQNYQPIRDIRIILTKLFKIG
jgi:hypothetical protein